MPKLSVVIPSYNRLDLIPLTLASIAEQTFRDFEVIIVDDNSDDGTQAWVKDFCQQDQRFRQYIKPAGLARGPAASKNLGFQHCTGDYIHFFDSDDILEPDVYERALAQLDNQKLDFLALRIRWFDYPAIREFGYSRPFTETDFLAKAIMRDHEIWTQNVLWRKSLLEQSPAHDEQLTMSEDIVFAAQAIVRAQRFAFDNDTFVDVRRHAQSLTFTQTPERIYAREVSVWRAYGLLVSLLQKMPSPNQAAIHYCQIKIHQAVAMLWRTRGLKTDTLSKWLSNLPHQVTSGNIPLAPQPSATRR